MNGSGLSGLATHEFFGVFAAVPWRRFSESLQRFPRNRSNGGAVRDRLAAPRSRAVSSDLKSAKALKSAKFARKERE